MIVSDNQSADSLGCYGSVDHETPRIDRLAREGTQFLRAFCTNGLCSPSRLSLLSGLMPSQHGVHLAMPDDEVLPKADDYDTSREFPTLASTLSGHGYATGMVGKWHLGNNAHPGNGFDHWVALTKGHTTDFYENLVYEGGQTHTVSGTHIVDYFTDRAIEFVNDDHGEKPWFLQVNFDGPYVLPPTVVGADTRNRFWDRFAGRTYQPFPPIDERLVRSLAVPFDFDVDPDEEYTLESAFNNTWWTFRIHNDRATRANIAAQNALVDEDTGRILDALEDSGQTEDTLVIYTTDQGNPYGQRGLWGHPIWTDPPFMHDVTFNVPLIVRRPGTVAEQRVNDRIVSHCDVFPTVCAHVGIEADLAASPGRSFAAALDGAALDGWVDEAFFENETARSIRTPRYLFTRHLGETGPAELYDLVDDPGQWSNVAARPDYAPVVAELGARIDQFWGEYRDDRYDLWRGGSAQGLVARYLYFKERYGPDWEVTADVGPPYAVPPA